ncbi:MAG: hypothetical protein MJZ84_01900 [Paludibacteraceae bacterium]|nr:hypothetical protein [Paludibacteraceae bacterium]
MKKILNYTFILSTLALTALTSCRNEDVTESTFMITPKTIHAHSAIFEVTPITNEFYYEADALTLEQYNQLGEQGVAEMTVQYYDSLKSAMDAQHIEYNNDYLYYKGMYDCATTGTLPASTPCIFYVMRLSSKTLEPIFPFVTYAFTTTKEISRDMTLDLTFRDNTIYVEPSDTFPYLWDYISKADLIEGYNNDLDYYARSAILMYEEYGFINNFVVKGNNHEYVLDWYPNLQAGDSIYALAVGYEQGELTTKIFSKSFAIQ